MFSFALWRLLREAGGRLHKQKDLRAHAKIAIADGKRIYLGTQNLDQPAFDLRRELGLVLDDTALTGAIAAVFEEDWKGSRKYEPPYPIDLPDAHEDTEFEHDADLRFD